MDRKISMIGVCINMAGVLLFALAMLTGPLYLCYIASIFIAWGLVMMNSGFYRFGRHDAKVAALNTIIFGGMYALCNTFVYYVQITTVANSSLNEQASKLLDYRNFSLFFDLDMLGYCLMAISTFFAGLTVRVSDRGDKWLKALLMIHGVFAVTCFVMPTLGLFNANMEGASWIGTLILEFWCVYFLPVGILSLRYFRKEGDKV